MSGFELHTSFCPLCHSPTATFSSFGCQVAAVAGGITYKNGQGMEFWNPIDGSVTVVVDQLPTELGALTPLQVSTDCWKEHSNAPLMLLTLLTKEIGVCQSKYIEIK